jgi:hypothetical protein
MQLANEIGATAYRETSALVGTGVAELFDTVVRVVLDAAEAKRKKKKFVLQLLWLTF